MIFSEIQTEIMRITSRPDKGDDTISAINRAVNRLTLKGDFAQDLVEGSLSVNAALYGATVSLTSLTRFRKFRYLKPTGVKYYLTPLPPEKIFTPKNAVQPNKYYIAGTSLTYTLGALTPTLEYGYFTYPIQLDAVTNNTHWMFNVIPFAVIDLAASVVFNTIGDEVSSKKFESSAMDLYNTYKSDVAQGD